MLGLLHPFIPPVWFPSVCESVTPDFSLALVSQMGQLWHVQQAGGEPWSPDSATINI